MGVITFNEKISHDNYYGKLINISGKQRMLSQRLMAEALLFNYQFDQSNVTRYKNFIKLMHSDHTILMQMPMEREVKLFYTKSPNLQKLVNDYLALHESYLQSPTPSLLTKIIKQSIIVLTQLEKAVKLHENAYNKSVKDLQLKRYIELVVYVLFLLSIWFLAVKPTSNQLRIFNETIDRDRKKYKSLIDLSSESIMILNPNNGTILEHSIQAAKFLGYSDIEMFELTILDWDKEFDSIVDFQATVTTLTDKPTYFERVYTRKDGSTYLAGISAVKVHILDEDVIYISTRDITKKRQNEEELKLSALKLKLAIDGNNLAYWEFDFQSGKITFSENGYNILGYTSAIDYDSDTKNWDNRVHPDDTKMTNELFEKLMSGEINSYHLQHRALNSQKEYIWLDVRAAASKRDEQGNCLQIIGIFSDISEQKEMELKLKELSTAFETQEGIIICDEGGVILRANISYCEQTGYTQEELLGKNPRIFHSNRHNISFYTQIWKTIASIGYWQGEIYNKKKDGTVFPAMVSIKCIKSNDIVHYVGSMQDITLQKSNQLRWEFAVEGNGDGLWDWNMITNEIYFSPQWKAMLGFKDYEISGTLEEWEKRIYPNQLEAVYADIHDYLAGKTQIYSNEHKVLCKDGSYKWILDRGSVVERDSEGNPLRMIGTHKDIEDEKRLRTQMKIAMQTAEKANKAKSEFLANMSHEIRTPLNGMIGLTDLVMRTNLTKQQRNYLERAMTSSKTLLNVINDILDYSKIEAGKLELESIPFLLERVIKNSTSLFSFQAHEKEIELHVDMDIELYKTLEGDSLRLQQILNNLLSNAIKFTNHGDITIKVKLKNETKYDITIIVSVVDTGIGIKPEKLKQLFEAFTQSDSSDTRNYGGTGLGLSICKHLTQLMGGKIWAESTLGQGSTFAFIVTLKKSKVSLSNNFIIANIRSKRFLVVDDNDIDRQLICEMLDSWKLKYDSCSNGNDAIKKATNEIYDYLIIDWKMPDIDGLQVIKKLNEIIGNNFPKVIMITAYQKEFLIKEANKINEQIPTILEKPLTASDLFDSFKMEHIPIDLNIETKKIVFNAKILVAEDNEVNQLVIKEYLNNFGCSVTLVENGAKAVSVCRDDDFDLIFMDIQMPVMNGYDATIAIRKFNSKIPIIALSAAVMERDRKTSLNAGMNEHIGKPIDPEELQNVMLRYLKGEVVENKDSQKPTLIFPQIDGIDTKALIEAYKNKEVIMQMFKSYIKSFENITEKFDSSLPIEILRKHIHALKGVSGNLHMYDIFTLTKAMNDNSNDEFIMDNLVKLKTLIEQSINNIKPILNTKNEITEVSITQTEAFNLLKELLELLKMGAFILPEDKSRYISALHKLGGANFAEEVNEQIENFDFDEAIEALNKLIKGN